MQQFANEICFAPSFSSDPDTHTTDIPTVNEQTVKGNQRSGTFGLIKSAEAENMTKESQIETKQGH